MPGGPRSDPNALGLLFTPRCLACRSVWGKKVIGNVIGEVGNRGRVDEDLLEKVEDDIVVEAVPSRAAREKGY